MKAEAIGRDEVGIYLSSIKEPFVWISIRESESDNNFYQSYTLPENCKGVLVLKFHDLVCDDWSEEGIREAVEQIPDFKPFDIQIKWGIDKFIERHKDVGYYLVNCHAGLNRSAVIAAYVERQFNQPDWYKRCENATCYYIHRILDIPVPENVI